MSKSHSQFLNREVLNINSLAEFELPFVVPQPFNFLGAFALEIGEKEINQPIQLAIPVALGTPPGTQVYFFRAGNLTDETGAERPAWYQVSLGIVGNDGFARTTSPLSLGVDQSGTYLVAEAPLGSIAEIQADFYSPFPVPDGYSLTIFAEPEPTTVEENLATQSFARFASDFSVESASFAPASFGFGFNPVVAWTIAAAEIAGIVAGSSYIKVGLPRGGDIKMLSVPPVGLPTTTSTKIQLNPTAVNRVTFNIPPSPSLNDQYLPRINNGQVNYTERGTELFLVGDRFKTLLPDGLEQVKVNFRQPNGQIISVRPESSTDFSLRVIVPNKVVLGLSDISITRTLTPTRGGTQEFTSNSITIEGKGGYVFAAASKARDQISNIPNQVVVINPNTSAGQSEIIAKIPIGIEGQFLRPWGIAATSDLSRAYVSLRDGTIALIDAQAFQQVDVKPLTPEMDAIVLPTSAKPELITLSPDNKYLFAADAQIGTIYAVDIDPRSRSYHSVQTFGIDNAPFGLRGLTVSNDGKRLYVGVPEGGQRETKNSRIIMINVDPTSDDWGEVISDSTQVQGNIASIITTPDPNKLIISNYNSDRRGIGILENGTISKYIDVTIGDRYDYFDVNTATGLAFLPANTLGYNHPDYLFVAGKNSPPSNEYTLTTDYRYIPFPPFILEFSKLANASVDQYDPYNPGGGTIGIIQNPFGTDAKLVAATRPIPTSFPESVVLSADGRRLLANFKNPGSVFVFDVQQMLRTIDANSLSGRLERIPINDVNPSIDLNADYRKLNPDTRQPYTSIGGFGKPPVFGVPDGSAKAPLTINGYPYQLAAQTENWLQLEGPMTNSESDRTPEFTWKYINGVTSDEIQEIKVYVSVFPRNQGLLPEDRLLNLNFEESNTLARILRQENLEDYHPNRILTAIWNQQTNQWTLKDNQTIIGTSTSLILPNNRELTAGQTYYWAVEATREDGQKLTKFGEFKTAPIKFNTPFNGVTMITHGFQLNLTSDDPPVENTPSHFIDMGSYISKAGGGDGNVYAYNRATGRWVSQSGVDATQATPGQPLVLVTNWVKESDIINSGFSEAAADSFFASLMQLNQELGNSVLNSPLHFIGHSRGTVVNSEIIQRLGTYFPSIQVQMTTLDPHDFVQPSLDVPLESLIGGFITGKLAGKAAGIAVNQIENIFTKFIGKQLLKQTIKESLNKILPDLEKFRVLDFSDFQDPDVQRWENVKFADNYYQKVAKEGQNDTTFTPNGRSIPGADIDVQLDGRTGFVQDDFIGSTHSRVWQWYGGTINLNISNYSNRNSLPIFRRVGDRGLIGNDFVNSPVPFFGFNGVPWYASQYINGEIPPYTRNFAQYSLNTSWEGIGEGWFYSALGSENRPSQVFGGVSVSQDNTEIPQEFGYPAVPTIFNGNFEYGNLEAPRFPLDSNEIPGWSFHGGYSGVGNQIPIYSNPESGTGAITYSDASEGTGRIGKESNGNHYLVLNDTFSSNEVTHNRFFIPNLDSIEGLSFKYWVRNAYEASTLNVYLNTGNSSGRGQLLGSIDISQKTNNFVTAFLALPDGVKGKAATLTFQLEAGIIDEVWIDDITLGSESIQRLTRENQPTEISTAVFVESDEILVQSIWNHKTINQQASIVANSNLIEQITSIPETNTILIPTVQQKITALTLNSSNTAVGILNSQFNINTPSNFQFGWNLRGSTAIVNEAAQINEGDYLNSGLSQSFVIPQGAKTLQFKILSTNLGSTLLNPPDAFEVALLNTQTMTPLLGTVIGLTQTDALLNIQNDGEIFTAPQVKIIGNLGSPLTVDIDISSLQAGTFATLYFDLLGFGQVDSSVILDDVVLITEGSSNPPTANNDTATTDQNQPVTIDVLANDRTNTTLNQNTLAIASLPSNGKVIINNNGTVTYTPNSGFAGNDSFTYTVKDNQGTISNVATVSITVNNLAPVITEIIGDTNFNEGSTGTFKAIANDPGNDTLTYTWNFGNNQIVTGQTTQYTFADNGEYQVTLNVTDTYGQATTQTFTVTVANIAPMVNAGADQTVTQNSLVNFAGQFTDPGILDTHTIEWDFGDGNKATNTLNPTHRYQGNGTYTVILTVTDKDGARTQDTLLVTVNTQLPKLTVDDVSVNTDEQNNTFALFTVRLSAPSQQPVSFNFNTSDGSAKAGVDYIATSGNITFAAGQTVQTMRINLIKPKQGDINGDGLVNQTDMNLILAARNRPATRPQATQKNFSLYLSNVTDAILDDNLGIATLSGTQRDPRDLDGDGLITVLDARKLDLIIKSQS